MYSIISNWLNELALFLKIDLSFVGTGHLMQLNVVLELVERKPV